LPLYGKELLLAKQKATLCWLITLVSLITTLIIAGCSGGSAGSSAFGPLGTGSTTGATTGTGSTGTGTGTTGGSGSTSGSTGASTGSGTTTGTTGSGTTTGSSGSGTATGSTTGGTGTTTGTTSGGTTTGGGTGSTPPPAGPGPVIVVLEENHDYSSVIGNSAMPYLNGLAQQYGLATQYYANTHPSIGNYFELTAGQIITNDDGYGAEVADDNIARHLIGAGKTWKEYSENIPSVGYIGGDASGYTQHHNPFSYFSDVRGSNAQRQNLVSVNQFTSDFSNGQLPNFSFVVPSNDNNAHDGTLSQADSWLKQKIDPVLATPQFKQNGLLIIVFDEAETDNSHGGGRVAMIMVGPRVKQGYKSTTFYQHQDLLKMIATYIGIDGNIGDAAGASDMSEFFNQ
jgi:phosphatidylinositol-3-phosphatase